MKSNDNVQEANIQETNAQEANIKLICNNSTLNEVFKTKENAENFLNNVFSFIDKESTLSSIQRLLSTFVGNVKEDESIDLDFFNNYLNIFNLSDINTLVTYTRFTKEHFEVLLNYKDIKTVTSSLASYALSNSTVDKYINFLDVFKDKMSNNDMDNLLSSSWNNSSKIIFNNELADRLFKFCFEKEYFKSGNLLAGFVFEDPNYIIENYIDYVNINNTILSNASKEFYKKNNIDIDVDKLLKSKASEDLDYKVSLLSSLKSFSKKIASAVGSNFTEDIFKEIAKKHFNTDICEIDDDMSISDIRRRIVNNIEKSKDILQIINEKHSGVRIPVYLGYKTYKAVNMLCTGEAKGKFKVKNNIAKLLFAISSRNIYRRTKAYCIVYDSFILGGFKFDNEFYKQLADENNSLFEDVFTNKADKNAYGNNANTKWENLYGFREEYINSYLAFLAKKFIINNNIPKEYVEAIHKKFLDCAHDAKAKENITYDFIRTQHMPESIKEDIEENPRLLRALAVSSKCSKKEKVFAKLCSDSII